MKDKKTTEKKPQPVEEEVEIGVPTLTVNRPSDRRRADDDGR
jgi:hypothetical protein